MVDMRMGKQDHPFPAFELAGTANDDFGIGPRINDIKGFSDGNQIAVSLKKSDLFCNEIGHGAASVSVCFQRTSAT